MHHCKGDTLMRKNGLHAAYSKLGGRDANQAVIEERLWQGLWKGGTWCNFPVDLVQRSARSPWRRDCGMEGGEHSGRGSRRCKVSVIGCVLGPSEELRNSPHVWRTASRAGVVSSSQSMESLISQAKDAAFVLRTMGSSWMVEIWEWYMTFALQRARSGSCVEN